MSIKNVIIIGASGNLGPSVLDVFLKESSFNTTVLARQSSKATFPSGVKVIRADFESSSSLKDAFQGQDAVVSLVGATALSDQNKIIDAAIDAGVKRFIPSEFGTDAADKRTRDIVPFLAAKYAVVNYLKTKEDAISWTGVVTGGFFDWGLKVGFLGFDGSSKTATIYDEGKATVSATNLHQIGAAVVKVLENADQTKNQYVYVSGFQTSQIEILGAVEKLSGAKWTVKHVATDALIAEGQAKIEKGDFSGIPDLIIGAIFGAEQQLGDLSPAGLWNDKLGLPKESFEETIRSALSL